jgi:hypothetical protein
MQNIQFFVFAQKMTLKAPLHSHEVFTPIEQQEHF